MCLPLSMPLCKNCLFLLTLPSSSEVLCFLSGCLPFLPARFPAHSLSSPMHVLQYIYYLQMPQGSHYFRSHILARLCQCIYALSRLQNNCCRDKFSRLL